MGGIGRQRIQRLLGESRGLRSLQAYAGRPIGYVERIVDGCIEGWLWDERRPRGFHVSLGGQLFETDVTRIPRPDVQAVYRQAPLDTGFSLAIPKAIFELEPGAELSTLLVRYGKSALTVSEEFRNSLGRNWLRRSATDGVADHPTKSSEARAFGVGHLGRNIRQAGLSLSVSSEGLFNGGNLAVRFADQIRPVVPIGSSGNPTGKIELPPDIWDYADASGQIPAEVMLEDALVGAVTLSADNAARALDLLKIRPRSDVAEVLLGLEHARHLNGFYSFSGALRSRLLEWATLFGCSDLLDELAADQPGLADGFEPETATRQQRFHQAFDDVADVMLDPSTCSADTIRAIAAKHELDVQDTFALFQSFVGEYCRQGIFSAVKDALSDDQIAQMVSGRDAYHASLALPFLTARGEFEEAAAALCELPGAPGWVANECIREASAQVAGANIPFERKSAFAYALIAYLEHLRGRYWSFQYNTDVVGAVITWLDQLQSLPVGFRSDLVDVVLSTFSLSRDFWSRLEVREPACVESARLERARGHFASVERLSVTPLRKDAVVGAIQALQVFQTLKNPDADVAMREVVICALDRFADDAELCDQALNAAHQLGDLEQLRLASHPSNLHKSLSDAPDVTADIIRQVAAANPEQAASGVLGLQDTVGRLLADDDPTSEQTEEVLRKANQLASVDGGWMAADVVLRLAQKALDRGEPDSGLLSEAQTLLAEAFTNEEHPQHHPALHSAVSKLFAFSGEEGLSALEDETRKSCGEIKWPNAKQSLNAAFTQTRSTPSETSLHSEYDTLVVVYSCRKYLSDRIPLIRKTWVADLKARGIPYVILVGDGDDTLDGDVLQLDVADTYEALPAKTLKLIRWVHDNTDFQYLVKIDDDCLLSVDRFFDAQSYRKFNYFGRKIRRNVGETQRDWHQVKSADAEARLRLDRSPEPSTYCDGGGGYSLSRYAMSEALAAAESSEGKWLTSVSYFEDKLLGDLLAMRGISPSNQDYMVHILRTPGKDQKPVSTFDNRYFPSRSTPVSLIHLDGTDELETLHQLNKSTQLAPRKIWPTHSDMKLGWNTHQLEFIGHGDSLDQLRKAEIVVVAVIRNERTLLPQFLAHYRALGVTSFLLADNLSDDGSREFLLEQPDVALYSVDSEYKASHFGVDWQQALIGNHCIGKWVVVVDADEFLTYSDIRTKPLAEIAARADHAGFDCIGAELVDMYPQGALSDCDFDEGWVFDLAPYHDNPPVRPVVGSGVFANTKQQFTSALRHRLAPGSLPTLFMANKYPMIKYHPAIRLSEGIHFVGNVRIAPEFLTLAHFKYHAGFAAKIEREIKRAQHYGSGMEYQKYKTMMAETQGTLHSPAASKRLSERLQPARPMDKQK